MPIITQVGISNGKLRTINITVSDEAYKKYKLETQPIGNPIPAEFFESFLNNNNIPFTRHDSATFIYGIEMFSIAIWKDAEFFSAEDIKNALLKSTVTYSNFIDAYAEYLKTL